MILNASTIRTSWMANNAIPDSIIMNMICRYLLPPVEPKIRSTEVLGIARVTLRILNTIMPVTRVFTAMDAVKPVIINMFPEKLIVRMFPPKFAKLETSQEARGNKLK